MCTYKNIFLLFLFSLFQYTSYAQLDGAKQKDTWMEDNIFLDGKITDYYSGETIAGVNIQAIVSGAPSVQGNSNRKGEFKTVLDYDKIYTITFSKPGYISKTITMNTNGVADINKQKVPDMIAEITLFQPNKCIQAELLEEPIGRAIYLKKENRIDWDMVYSMPRLAALNEMLDDCAKQAEEQRKVEAQKEKDYNVFLKIANKSFAKENWNAAAQGFKEALQLFADRPEPAFKLKLIETELAKKAEAEKQRAAQKSSAEAEAIAKEEAETAAKKAKEEGLAKELAEKEAIARANEAAIEKEKAEIAAKKAEKERLAKEIKEAEAFAKKEAEEKEKLIQEAASKKRAEEKALVEKATALAEMAAANKAAQLAMEEAQLRGAAQQQALEEKEAANQREVQERKAKELAAQLAQKAEKERAANKIVLLEIKEVVKIEIEAAENSSQKATPPSQSQKKEKSNNIKFKTRSKTRHLYEKPNKHRKGKGPQPKKRIVF